MSTYCSVLSGSDPVGVLRAHCSFFLGLRISVGKRYFLQGNKKVNQPARGEKSEIHSVPEDA